MRTVVVCTGGSQIEKAGLRSWRQVCRLESNSRFRDLLLSPRLLPIFRVPSSRKTYYLDMLSHQGFSGKPGRTVAYVPFCYPTCRVIRACELVVIDHCTWHLHTRYVMEDVHPRLDKKYISRDTINSTPSLVLSPVCDVLSFYNFDSAIKKTPHRHADYTVGIFLLTQRRLSDVNHIHIPNGHRYLYDSLQVGFLTWQLSAFIIRK